VRAYVDASEGRGDDAVILALESLGHFETSVVLPSTESAFKQALSILLEK
jgi:hypothetical protein